ncbi:thioredoxin family protein [Mycobacterium shigaense]|uniref:Thiol reductase thioredoxin n=1 Tax=Mycobacterium shigaense TaxID=722731 RepID=A0A1Z4EN99_9MYCO|nr:thioredoxin family protein [Mycobacterium shigaense]MEA1120450.1 thioredoxin family protein [Mycobacterium shigaense]PRI14396.1 thiol reductase thioredoxin [Mycobacterium shigaense]BAX94483.1 thiol reductase thioredoxin [Mycobacterium shigaense]
MTTVLVAIVAAFALAAAVGWLLTRRSGSVREVAAEAGDSAGADATDLGLSTSGPTIVHFSAPWCGPCDRVRRVVDQVCGDMGAVAHVEIDIDANPAAARRFSVLSLPTTLIFDVDGRQRYRASGIPKAVDLRSALEPLLA